jgi:hypothetical protein
MAYVLSCAVCERNKTIKKNQIFLLLAGVGKRGWNGPGVGIRGWISGAVSLR